ncbi:ribonuclease P protein component [soil metagenome]
MCAAHKRFASNIVIAAETSTPRLFFRRAQRIGHAREFEAAFAARCSVARGPLRVHAVLNSTVPPTARLGLSIGRRLGNAVTRHHLKRMLREVFRLHQHTLPVGVDFVISAHQHGALTLAQYAELILPATHQLAARLQARAARDAEPKPKNTERGEADA